MKTLRESLLDDNLVRDADEMIIKDEIESFLKENYDYINYMGAIKISNKPNKDGKYEVSSTTDVGVKNKNITSLTNGMFVWINVDGDFNCSRCVGLESLKGAPEKVSGTFSSILCSSLTSLEGAPKEVGNSFLCSVCYALKTLEGAPKSVASEFNCSNCIKLTSLKGAPQKVNDFVCSHCIGLKSLEGAPKETINKFICSSCASLTSLKGISKTAKVIDASNNVNLKSLDGLPEEADYVWVPKHFTEDDVRKICKVRDHVVLY